MNLDNVCKFLKSNKKTIVGSLFGGLCGTYLSFPLVESKNWWKTITHDSGAIFHHSNLNFMGEELSFFILSALVIFAFLYFIFKPSDKLKQSSIEDEKQSSIEDESFKDCKQYLNIHDLKNTCLYYLNKVNDNANMEGKIDNMKKALQYEDKLSKLLKNFIIAEKKELKNYVSKAIAEFEENLQEYFENDDTLQYLEYAQKCNAELLKLKNRLIDTENNVRDAEKNIYISKAEKSLDKIRNAHKYYNKCSDRSDIIEKNMESCIKECTEAIKQAKNNHFNDNYGGVQSNSDEKEYNPQFSLQ